MRRAMPPKWGRLPETGESSFCNVLKGLDTKKFNKQYPHKRARTSLRAVRPFVACLRRYFLSRGLQPLLADKPIAWGYPPQAPIRPNPLSFYTIDGFASFTDAAEAFTYAAVLKSYYNRRDARVVRVNR